MSRIVFAIVFLSQKLGFCNQFTCLLVSRHDSNVKSFSLHEYYNFLIYFYNR